MADKENSYSTSGVHLAMIGPRTNYPLSGLSKGQTCISTSTPEAEIIAAALALRSEGIPCLLLWDVLLQRHVILSFHEDNQAMIRVMTSGRNPTMRTIGRTHGISVMQMYETFKGDDMLLMYCQTKKMRADIFTKGFAAPHDWDHACELINMFDTTKPKNQYQTRELGELSIIVPPRKICITLRVYDAPLPNFKN